MRHEVDKVTAVSNIQDSLFDCATVVSLVNTGGSTITTPDFKIVRHIPYRDDALLICFSKTCSPDHPKS
jgi:hypothetical protein